MPIVGKTIYPRNTRLGICYFSLKYVKRRQIWWIASAVLSSLSLTLLHRRIMRDSGASSLQYYRRHISR
jgi:hypothetical protein